MQPASSFFSVPTPPALPSPPLLEHLLLEQPIPLAVALLVLGLIGARIIWRRPSVPRLAWALVAILLAAAPGVVGLASLVPTDREQMQSAVTKLVRAVATIDTPELDRLMAPDCTLVSRFGFPGYTRGSAGMDKATILEQVPVTVRANPIVEHEIEACQPLSRAPGLGATQILVRVVVEYPGARIPVQSWWRVDWRRDPDGTWRAFSIEALTNPGGASELR